MEISLSIVQSSTSYMYLGRVAWDQRVPISRYLMIVIETNVVYDPKLLTSQPWFIPNVSIV